MASFRPWEGSNRRLLVELQRRLDLSEDLWLAAPATGQPLLLPPADAFLRRVDWDGGQAVAWRPDDDAASPVRCRPGFRGGGGPSVSGISTAAIFEHIESGESIDEVARDFDLTVHDVRWAFAYETSFRAPVAA